MKFKAGLAFGLLAVAMFLIIKACRTPRQSLAVAEVDCATVLAEQTSTLLTNRGQVVIISRDPQKLASVRDELGRFRKALKKAGAVTVIANIALTEAQLPSPVTRMPAAPYLDAIQRYPNADAIVSFVGAPELTAQDLRRAGTPLPRLAVLAPANIDPAPWFELGALQVVIMPRAKLPPGDPQQLRARDRFNFYYEIVTPTGPR